MIQSYKRLSSIEKKAILEEQLTALEAEHYRYSLIAEMATPDDMDAIVQAKQSLSRIEHGIEVLQNKIEEEDDDEKRNHNKDHCNQAS